MNESVINSSNQMEAQTLDHRQVPQISLSKLKLANRNDAVSGERYTKKIAA
jgi:hypothetical protein